jgi:hypothetical protein
MFSTRRAGSGELAWLRCGSGSGIRSGLLLIACAAAPLALGESASAGAPDVAALQLALRLQGVQGSPLSLHAGAELVRILAVATGRRDTPTPLGRFTIAAKARRPWWYPPAADWAEGLDPIPPGPGNPLGTRWMGLSVRGVGIHGTLDTASVGYSRSHGCIRLYRRQAEWLFRRVRIGTPVLIVPA